MQTIVGSTYRTMVYDILGHDVADYSGSTGGTLERENIYRGGLLATVASGAIKYVLQDAQGSTRAVTDNNGSGSLVVVRHDYLPFGEEITSTARTSALGYGVTDGNRQKYGLTERDDDSGLDHTWFRKSESLSGRWTSPDPYGGSMSIGDPQSFNRYAYVGNDPVNFVDPSGLDPQTITISYVPHYPLGRLIYYSSIGLRGTSGSGRDTSMNTEDPGEDGGEPGGDPAGNPHPSDDCRRKALGELASELGAREEAFRSDNVKPSQRSLARLVAAVLAPPWVPPWALVLGPPER